MGNCRLVIAVLVVAMVTSVFGSDFKVSKYPDPSGSVTQIWIEAEDFDSKTAEFVVDSAVEGARGEALYCPTYSPMADMQQWWMEYSIDSADTQIDAADLTGTWYCWVRVNQPSVDAEEADYLVVKGDANDGSGTDWYSTAFSTLVDPNDRIANDINGLVGAGVGVWGWLGEAGNGVAKDFNLDVDNKIVFRINEREGGPGNARIDAICWTNDASYVPTDADFDDMYVTDGLVFDFNASDAGAAVTDYAKPLVAHSSDAVGTLKVANQSPLVGVKPAVMREAAAEGGYNWFYRFISDTTTSTSNEGSGGFIGDIDPYQALNFDFNDSFTVEVWFRVTEAQPNRDYGVLFGSQYGNATGYRTSVRTSAGYPFVELFLRDNTDDADVEGNERWSTGSIRTANLEYSSEFQHVLFTVKGYDETGTDQIKFNVWNNGTHHVTNGTLTPTAGASMVQSSNYAAIGVTYDVADGSQGRMPYKGDIAAVRVYGRVLSDAEALRNYTVGMASDTSWQCGGVQYDVNGDCVEDLQDFAIVAAEWLNCNKVPDGCN